MASIDSQALPCAAGEDARPAEPTKEEHEPPGTFSLSFKDLSCAVRVKKPRQKDAQVTDAEHTKTILTGVSGVCRGGRLVSIMGPSGAGKTTLLNLLAGRQRQTTGQLCLGHKAGATAEDVRKCAAYVQQDDAILASQTVREALTMAAFLLLPRDMAKEQKLQRVTSIVATFQLEGCIDTLVGDPVGKLKGLSGGERKRLAVAMSMVQEPKVIFLDEPTSGLDTFKAYILVSVLKDLAKNKGSVVVCTIHQPSSDIFALFDDLLLLLGGHTVYNGLASESVPYFADRGYPCPQFANPADFFFMHVLSDSSGLCARGTREQELVQKWNAGAGKDAVDKEVDECIAQASPGGKNDEVVRRSGLCAQFTVLLRRGLFDLKRNPSRGIMFLVQSTVMAIIISLIWFQVDDSQTGVQDRSGVMFFMVADGMMGNIMGVLTAFGNERGAVLREHENGMYSLLPYFLARIMVDVPVKMLGSALSGTITYWAVGFQPHAGRFFVFVVLRTLLALSANAMGLFLACIFPDIAVALAVAPLLILPLIMFSGFVVNTASIPVYFIWVQWLSPAKYAFIAMARNEFGGLNLHCSADQIRVLPSEDGGGLVPVCSFPSGEVYLDSLNFQSFLSIGACAAFLGAEAVAFTVLAFAGLVFVARRSSGTAPALAL